MEFEHRATSLDTLRLVDDLGAALNRRAAFLSTGSTTQQRFRLIQYVDYERRREASTDLHPLVSIEWRIEPYRNWYYRDYYELPVQY